MRISDIINWGVQYLKLGVILALFVAVLFAVGYFLIYRKLLKGTKRLRIGQLLLWGVMLCYAMVVFGATLGNRGGWFGQSIELLPFSSYWEAWCSFSATEWRNLILNILLFVPFGFLLPFHSKKCRRFWVTYGAGLLVTLFIEITQLITKRGVFEMDDIINNTAGTMIGFGIASIVLTIYARIRKQESQPTYNAGSLICLQIPLISVILALTVVFTVYYTKELGNLVIAPYGHQDMSKVTVSNIVEYSGAAAKAHVYQATIGTADDTSRIANDIFALKNTAADEERTDLYNDTAIYWSLCGRYNMWVDYKGLTYSFNAFLDDSEVRSDPETGISQSKVFAILQTYGIELPEDAEFTETEDGSYQIIVDMADMGEYYLNGTLYCEIIDEDVFYMRNYLMKLEPYKEYELISEQEAYERLLAGKFELYAQIDEIIIKDLELVYTMDSKGFYQPVYQFNLEETNGETAISIPAIK